MSDNINLRLFRVWNNASKTVFKNLHKDIKSYDISSENFMVLELLYHKGKHTVQKISEILCIPSGSITYVVNKLEKEGHVRKSPCPKDKRRSYVILEEKGKAFFDEIFPNHAKTIAENFEGLSLEEKESLIVLLKKVGLSAKERKD